MNTTIFTNGTQFLNIRYIFQQYFSLTEKGKSELLSREGGGVVVALGESAYPGRGRNEVGVASGKNPPSKRGR